MPSFYPLEINGTKYLICKLSNQPFSTLHDPETKQMVGQWNNDTAQYELFPPGSPQNDDDIAFERHMQELIASGKAFTFAD